MGCAELIPGVSGSTVALLFKVYEHIILSAKVLTSFGFWQRPIQEFKKYEILNIFLLIFFMALGVLFFSKTIVYIFENYSQIFYLLIAVAMLIIAFLIIFRSKNDLFSISSLLPVFAGITFGFMLGSFNPGGFAISSISLFLAGLIAFSFFIIPGISGSAILVVIGFYEVIIRGVSELDFEVLFPFGMGCLLALIILPRIILVIYSKHQISLDNFFSGLIFISGILLF